MFLLLDRLQTFHMPRLWQVPPFQCVHTSVLLLTKTLMQMPPGASLYCPVVIARLQAQMITHLLTPWSLLWGHTMPKQEAPQNISAL